MAKRAADLGEGDRAAEIVVRPVGADFLPFGDIVAPRGEGRVGALVPVHVGRDGADVARKFGNFVHRRLRGLDDGHVALGRREAVLPHDADGEREAWPGQVLPHVADEVFHVHRVLVLKAVVHVVPTLEPDEPGDLVAATVVVGKPCFQFAQRHFDFRHH